MDRPITLKFVGWDRPLLHTLRDLLLRDPPRLGAAPDLSGFTVVLPGARAGRRLVELLAGAAAPRAIVPPRVLTLGPWTALGVRAERPPASDFARLLAWAQALGSLPEDLRRHVAGVEEGDPASLLGVARLIDRAHVELAGELVTFDDVARHAADARGVLPETDRWAALAAVQHRYEELLAGSGMSDPHLVMLEGVRGGRIERDALGGGGRVILAGLSELNAAARRMASEVADRVTVLVPAPEEARGRFDAFGCPVPTAWEDVSIEVPDDAVTACADPQAQSVAVLRRVAALSGAGRLTPDAITIGVPDAEVEEQLRRLSGRLGTAPVRRAEGTPVTFTRPVKLLLAAGAFVERRDFHAFATLLRHADVEHWVNELLALRGVACVPGGWLHALDEYHAEHLHGRLDGGWLTGDEPRRALLAALHEAALELVGPLNDPEPEPLAAWAPRVWDLLRAPYSGFCRSIPRPLTPAPLEPTGREACNVLREHLRASAGLPAELGAGMLFSGAEALRFFVEQATGVHVPEAGDAPAIDMVGWLELALDDAPHMIVTGMNEGRAPAAPGVDALLPEPLRRSLGLRDRAARAARDALAMHLLCRSRPEGSVRFIFGRRSDAGDPLAPSRLLLMGSSESLARRVGQWTSTEPDQNAGVPLVDHGDSSRFDVTGRLLHGAASPGPVEEMSVTSFRDYIASPYLFYLRHVLRLREVEEPGAELDAMGFGNLVHAVLQTLVGEPVRASHDAGQIEAFLLTGLDAAVSLAFGRDQSTEIWVQVEQARRRLRAFAAEQAAWAAQGWRVAATEWGPPKRTASLRVDGTPMYLRGRIDRIDTHPDGRWAIIDYKTGNAPPGEKDARGADGVWKNPQLPLYRHLAASLASELGVDPRTPPVLAWVALPSKIEDTAFVEPAWTEEDLRSADAAAADVVRRVRAGEFGSLGDFPPCDGVIGRLCGQLEREGDDA